MANLTARKVHKQIYPATYNFKGDDVGSAPSGWEDLDGGTCKSTIIAELDGHKKILQLNDTDGAAIARLRETFTQGLNTVIELHVAKDSIAANTDAFILIEEGGLNIIQLRYRDDDLQYFDGAFQTIKDNFLVANIFSHLKLILDDTANTFDCYIAGILALADIPYLNNTTLGVSRIDFSTDAGDNGYKFFIDAIGISTDTSYTVGDNIHWRHYKDQDSDFESEDVGTSGTSIGFVDTDNSGAGTSVSISAKFNEHKKVLRVDDQSGANIADLIHNFASGQISGVIDFWIETTDAELETNLDVKNQGGNSSIILRLDADGFYVNPGGAGYTFLQTALDNTNYNIKFEFECGAGGFRGLESDAFYIWIGNVRYGRWLFSVNATTLDSIRIYTLAADLGYTSYFDAFSFSWTSGNEIADNRTLDYKPQSYDDITSNLSLAEVSDEAYNPEFYCQQFRFQKSKRMKRHRNKTYILNPRQEYIS